MRICGMLEATLTADTGGGAVEFTFTVTNGGTEPAELYFRTGKTADVVVSQNDETVWRWGENRAFTQAIRELFLNPGEEISESFTWHNPPAGKYAATGILEIEGGPTAKTTFTVSE